MSTIHQHRYQAVGSNFEFVIFRCMECGNEFEDPCNESGYELFEE